MAKVSLKAGTTSYIAQVFIQDSSSTTGAGLTGLLFNTASLTAYFHRDTDTTATAMTLVTMTVGTFTSLGFKEIDATNMPGWYQICPPNTALASGAKSCAIHLKGATNMAPLALEFELTAIDNQDAVRAGLTALPNVASGSAGAIPTTGTGANQINVTGGRADADVLRWNTTAVATPATAGIPEVNVKNINNVATTSVTTVSANQGTTQPLNFTGTAGSALVKSDTVDIAGTAQTARDIGASVLLSAGTGTGQLDFTSGVVKANLTQILGTALTETAGQIAAAFKKFFNIATPASTMDALTLVATATNLTNAPTAGDLTATMKTSVTTAATAATPTAAAVTGSVGSVVGLTASNLDTTVSSRLAASSITLTGGQVSVDAGSKTGLRLGATGVGDILTTALTESYAADNAAPTLSQAIFAIQQMMQERAISSTTMTVKKLDGSTTAMTFTLDSASSPTTITRAT